MTAVIQIRRGGVFLKTNRGYSLPKKTPFPMGSAHFTQFARNNFRSTRAESLGAETRSAGRIRDIVNIAARDS